MILWRKSEVCEQTTLQRAGLLVIERGYARYT